MATCCPFFNMPPRTQICTNKMTQCVALFSILARSKRGRNSEELENCFWSYAKGINKFNSITANAQHLKASGDDVAFSTITATPPRKKRKQTPVARSTLFTPTFSMSFIHTSILLHQEQSKKKSQFRFIRSRAFLAHWRPQFIWQRY